jgi:hypothetical protein
MVRTVIRDWFLPGRALTLPVAESSVADRYRNMNPVLQGPCHL